MTPDPALAQLADVAAGPAMLLFVDDEENILSSLKRLFRPHGYAVLTATSGERGLELLGQHPVDLVISDMRMPEMDGAQFLERVRRDWPDTVRILLTGYADISSTVAAINRGEIYRYISKPWEDNDVVLVVKQALERKMLEREKKRLEGILLLARDYMLDDSLVDQIKAFEQTEGITIKVHVRASMEETLPPHF
jgi:response regulator RpfG family c-di-GMP phosphodiesterase